MVTAAVDVRSMTVSDGDRRFHFTADCAAGTATLECDGRSIRVRLLRWGEKCALARFASAGPEFLSGQMLRACVGDGTENELEHGAALALTLWLHAPDEPPLPMDVQLLARVTLDVCRALGAPVEALAQHNAPEIEALWRALDRVVLPAQTAADDDVTQIIVVPDGAAAAASLAAPLLQAGVEMAAAALVPSPAHKFPVVAAALPTGHGAITAAPADAAPMTPAPARVEARPRFRVGLARTEPAAPRAEGSVAARSARAASDAPPVMTARPDWPSPSPAGADRPTARPGDGLPQAHAAGAVSVAPPSAPDAQPRAMAPIAPRRAPMAAEALPASDQADAALARVIAAVTRKPASPQPAGDRNEEVLDDLAERLEAAADVLGIALAD